MNIQTYGGGQWQTWFDRDLSFAGKVVVKDEKNKLTSKLLRIQDPILRIPNLPIHLSTDRGLFQWNDEKNLKAFLATTFFDDLDLSNSRISSHENLRPLEKV